jgi:site-specific recombinase XerD
MKQNNDALKISRLYNDWIKECENVKSQCTARSYESTMNSFVSYLTHHKNYKFDGFCGEDAFSNENIGGWMLWLRDVENIKPQSCNVRLSCLRSFLKFISKKNLRYSFVYLYSKDVAFFKTDKLQVKSLSKNAVKTLLSIPDIKTFIGMRDYVLMSMMYITGCRIDEVLSVQLRDLHLNVKDRPFVSVLGKGSVRRSPYLPKNIASNLTTYIRKYHLSDDADRYLFYSNNKGPDCKLTQEAIRKQLSKYAEVAHQICGEVPLDFHSHQFRHSMAVHRLEDDMNIVQLSKELGHASIETTMIYLDVVPGKKERAIAELESEEIKKLPRKWTSQIQKLEDIFKRNRQK